MNDAATEALIARYRTELANSGRVGQSRLAGEATHDSWRQEPFPVVFERGSAAYKWDIDGRRYVDLWMGHGALMLGNGHPAVVDAVARQAALGQHLGGVHRLHHEWAERIGAAFPSCAKVRFCASGTEATLLAMRVARAWTGRSRIVRIDGHFHGWHDDALAHTMPDTAGFNPGAAENVSLVPPLDIGGIKDELADNDVAAIILEPGGGSAGSLPWTIEYLQALRQATQAYGTLLIFDEVISGFRYAPGGVQQLAGVTPDLTVLAKIAAGGMPGGIVGGNASVMGVFGGGPAANGVTVHVPHSGTFNGFPLSAAAACATLDLVRDGEAGKQAEAATARIVVGINGAARKLGVDVRAFHQSSVFHLMVGAVAARAPAAPGPAAFVLARRNSRLHCLMRAALLLEHVDCHASHGWVSMAHDDAAVEEAIEAFAQAFAYLREIPGFATSGKELPVIASTGCDTVCHEHDCAARVRSVAQCSLPLASAES